MSGRFHDRPLLVDVVVNEAIGQSCQGPKDQQQLQYFVETNNLGHGVLGRP